MAREAKNDGMVAFIDVNVVPMTAEKILPHQTVVVAQEKILQIADANAVTLPESTLKIAAHGKYLMPGLADMHTHAWEEADLLLFLANGVTVIRNMWGSPRQLAWRKKIKEGTLLGPEIFTCGPLIDGSPPIWNSSKVLTKKEEAEGEISHEKKVGYDFVKVYNRLPVEVYAAILASAKKWGIPVVGHVPDRVGLFQALEAGQYSIEHLTGYIEAIQAVDSPLKNVWDKRLYRRAIDYADERKLPEVVSATKNSGTWNCVTLVVYQKFVSAEEGKELLLDPRMKFVPPNILASWDPSKDFRLKEYTAADFRSARKADEMRARITRELHKAGARILLGTDTPNPFVIPGFSIHEELRNLVEAGLSPFEAIKAGTKDAAEFLQRPEEFGTVEQGKRADLVLLDGNPLEDVSKISDPAGLMLRGKWYSREQLQEMLRQLVASYSLTEEDFERYYETRHWKNNLASGQLSRYRFKTSEKLLGEERFTLSQTSRSVLIESLLLLNAPPRINSFLMRLQLNPDWTPISLSYESQESEGNCQVTMKREEHGVNITGKRWDGSKLEMKREVPDSILFGSLYLASLLPLVQPLLSVEVGQKLEFKMLRLESFTDLDFQEATMQFRRQADFPQEKLPKEHEFPGKDLRAFDFEDSSSNSSFAGSLFINADNRAIILLERANQQGLDRFELVEGMRQH